MGCDTSGAKARDKRPEFDRLPRDAGMDRESKAVEKFDARPRRWADRKSIVNSFQMAKSLLVASAAVEHRTSWCIFRAN
jgi:hypothetical protein